MNKSILIILVFCTGIKTFGQQIVLDRKVQAGDLTLYPLRTDSNSYYYLPFPRLAVDENGKPLFSFIRYVTNKDLGTADQGSGGGIITGIVELKVTDEEKTKAESKLKTFNPKGKIVGAVSYKSGTMSIISALIKSRSNPNAPPRAYDIRKGNSFSGIQLPTKPVEESTEIASKENPGGQPNNEKRDAQPGASLPVESLDKEAVTIAAILDEAQVEPKFEGEMIENISYSTQAPLLEGGKAAFSLLVNKLGATVLWEQFKMAVPAIILQFSFVFEGLKEPLPARVIANWDEIYNHAAFNVDAVYKCWDFEADLAYTSLLKSQAIYIEYVGDESNTVYTDIIKPVYDLLKQEMFENQTGTGLNNEKPEAAGGNPSGEPGGDNSLSSRLSKGISDWNANNKPDYDKYKTARIESEDKVVVGQKELTKLNEELDALNSKLKEAGSEIEKLELIIKKINPADTTTLQELETRNTELTEKQSKFKELETEISNKNTEIRTKNGEIDKGNRDIKRNKSDEEEELDQKPTTAGHVSLVLKKEKKSGKFTFDMRKWTIIDQPNNTVASVGGLGRFKSDKTIFLEINTDDPLWRQRTIKVNLEGINSVNDFDKGLNSVNFRFRKKHENGDITLKDLVINKNFFNKEGNSFAVGYGNKGDKNQLKWQDYEYTTTWNYFGGIKFEEPTQYSKSGGIVLSSPYDMNQVFLDFDKEECKHLGIHSVTLDFYYKVGLKEFTKKINIPVMDSKEILPVDLLAARDNFNYSYTVAWNYKNGEKKIIDKTRSTDIRLFISPPKE